MDLQFVQRNKIIIGDFEINSIVFHSVLIPPSPPSVIEAVTDSKSLFLLSVLKSNSGTDMHSSSDNFPSTGSDLYSCCCTVLICVPKCSTQILCNSAVSSLVLLLIYFSTVSKNSSPSSLQPDARYAIFEPFFDSSPQWFW